MTTKFDESLESLWRMWRQLETYKLVYGELPETYGKVDTLTAYKTYREKESFHQNFGRYVEALNAKLERESAASHPPQSNQGITY